MRFLKQAESSQSRTLCLFFVYRSLTPPPPSTLWPTRRPPCEREPVFVASGTDGGGFLSQNHQGTFTVVPAFVDALDIPVIAAGGINDARGVRAARVLGAQGVYVGARFLLTAESPAAASTKATIARSTPDQVALVSDNQRGPRPGNGTHTPTPKAVPRPTSITRSVKPAGCGPACCWATSSTESLPLTAGAPPSTPS